MLGKGTFGQVVKCEDLNTKELSAIKVFNRKIAYFRQGMVETKILDIVNIINLSF